MSRAAFALCALSACAKTATPVGSPNPIESVTMTPHSSSSPNDPVLLVGPSASEGAFERVEVTRGRPEADFRPPKDRCPDGITELDATHVPLGQTIALAPGASPVTAMGADPEALEVTFDPERKLMRMRAKKQGLVYVVVVRDGRCTLYGVNAGY